MEMTSCNCWYEDLLASGLVVTAKCPVCASAGLDSFVGSHPHKPAACERVDVSSSKPGRINLHDFELAARTKLERSVFGYYSSGANDEVTLAENREAFKRMRIFPRMCVDVSTVDMSTTILGQRVSMPLCVAPTALQMMAHEDGECATAAAVARKNTIMTLSTMSTRSMEEVATAFNTSLQTSASAEEAALLTSSSASTSSTLHHQPPHYHPPHNLLWFQLYVHTDKAVTAALIRRAEEAGYSAIVVTVDAPLLGRREADIRNEFKIPQHLTLGNFRDELDQRQQQEQQKQEYQQSGIQNGSISTSNQRETFNKFFAGLICKTLTWDDIAWLKSRTRLKIVVKGILNPLDAQRAIDCGVDGIWVSNHGARQLDTVPATLEVLAAIVKVVEQNKATHKTEACEVYLDGGIRRGTDIFKAIALGAKAVFVGRPVVWGLAHAGEEGVCQVLDLLQQELLLAMQLAGCVNIAAIKREMVCWAWKLPEVLEHMESHNS